jgi:uncharacterized protein YndB with AHSA1/START domain
MVNRSVLDAMKGLVARAQVRIGAPVSVVWDALVNPEMIRQYMFGTEAASEWREGSVITWRGVWQGKEYEDKGIILEMVPGRRISYSHFSPLSGLPEIPENYHNVTVELSRVGDDTVVRLSQDNNPTEEARLHSQRNWEAMLVGLKNLLESKQHKR